MTRIATVVKVATTTVAVPTPDSSRYPFRVTSVGLRVSPQKYIYQLIGFVKPVRDSSQTTDYALTAPLNSPVNAQSSTSP